MRQASRSNLQGRAGGDQAKKRQGCSQQKAGLVRAWGHAVVWWVQRQATGSRDVGSGPCPLRAWQPCPEGRVSPRCPLEMQLASRTWADPQTPFGRCPLGLGANCRPNGLQVSLTESQSPMAARSLAVHVVHGLCTVAPGSLWAKVLLSIHGDSEGGSGNAHLGPFQTVAFDFCVKSEK